MAAALRGVLGSSPPSLRSGRTGMKAALVPRAARDFAPPAGGARRRPRKFWYVYMLECEDGALYTGITTDVETRLKRHQAGRGSSYVRQHRAVRMVHTERVASKSEALRREIEIKGWGREKKLALLTHA